MQNKGVSLERRGLTQARTLIHASPRSVIIVSNRAQKAFAHWGAVRFVGSVRTRDLYSRFEAADAADADSVWVAVEWSAD